MDISDTLAPASDQLDAVDLLGGPRTFVIEKVGRNNSPDQPLNFTLAGFPRVWRPSKGMRRVLAYAWGVDAQPYAGRSVTLYCDPEVTFGRDKVGGIRISHLSHIDKPLSIPLLVTRGRSQVFTVQPLVEQQPPAADTPEPTAEEVAACTDIGALKAMWRAASPELRTVIETRVHELTEPTLDGAS